MLKNQLPREFEMKGLGDAKQILGMSIARDRATGTLKFSQSKYIKKVLENFNIEEVKPRNTPLGSHLRLSKKHPFKKK